MWACVCVGMCMCVCGIYVLTARDDVQIENIRCECDNILAFWDKAFNTINQSDIITPYPNPVTQKMKGGGGGNPKACLELLHKFLHLLKIFFTQQGTDSFQILLYIK